jgi:hypothetical protein
MGKSAMVEAQPPNASASSNIAAGAPALLAVPTVIELIIPTLTPPLPATGRFHRTASQHQPNSLQTFNVWRTKLQPGSLV